MLFLRVYADLLVSGDKTGNRLLEVETVCSEIWHPLYEYAVSLQLVKMKECWVKYYSYSY